jgi:methionyl-tRNA formyltransferase
VLLPAFFNQIIDAKTAALASIAAVNIHPSLLPEFRGVDPVFFSLLRGATAFGVSVHHIAPEIDEGAVILQHGMDPTRNTNDESVLARTTTLYADGAALFIDAMRGGLVSSNVPSRGSSPSTETVGRYDSWPTKAEVRTFLQAGHALWRWRDLKAQGKPN